MLAWRRGKVIDSSTLVIKRTHIVTRSRLPGRSNVGSFMPKPRGMTQDIPLLFREERRMY